KDGDLAAVVTPDPGDGRKRPAVVWATGGFGGIGSYLWEDAPRSNDQSAAAFREAGLVLMCPSWRGENDNPGRFELFYGEVEDFLAAIDYVKKLPYVDPDRVYIGGHSTGGTMTLLAAAAGADVRAAFSFGGCPDMVELMADGEGYGNTPYPASSLRDHELRSPLRYTKFIEIPTFYFEGEDNYFYVESAHEMERIANMNDVPFKAYSISGDHFQLLAPITKLIAEKIHKDSLPECNIDFTLSELEERWLEAHDVNPVQELNMWTLNRGEGDIGELMETLDGFAPFENVEILAYSRAVEVAVKKYPDPKDASDLLLFTEIYYEIDDGVRADFAERAGEPLRQWLDSAAADPASLGDDEMDNIFEILNRIASLDDVASGEFLYKYMEKGLYAEEPYYWESVWEWMYTDQPGFRRVIELFQEKPIDSYAGVSLLGFVNELFLDGEYEGEHPLNSSAGADLLDKWVAPESSAATSAALALAFVDESVRGRLISKALTHPDYSVKMEAAWADLKHGGEEGLKFLKNAALDPNYASQARSFFDELDKSDLIPSEARKPDFIAVSEMIDWLKHPNEIGDSPEMIKSIDKRKLNWPPAENENIDVWLFEFTYRFDPNDPLKTGYGFFGRGRCWSSFEEYETAPSAEELYIHHCLVELRQDSENFELEESVALEKLKSANPGVFN
ncbi:MAG: prolyl oligopeptidase family serine peptidase, partial [Verrucomicrobiota bacterium]